MELKTVCWCQNCGLCGRLLAAPFGLFPVEGEFILYAVAGSQRRGLVPMVLSHWWGLQH